MNKKCLMIIVVAVFASCDILQPPEEKYEGPDVQILSPADSSFFTESDFITFRGSVGGGNGAGGGNLSAGTFLWESSIDGELGEEKEITVSLSPGEHKVTFTATDAANIPASISISVFVYSDINLGIIEPENNSLHFAGDAIFCKIEVEPEEYVDNIIWKLDGDIIDCSDGKFSVNERGKYALSAEVEKEGGVLWKASVSFEVLPIISGRVYSVDGGNAEGMEIVFSSDDYEDAARIDSGGKFEIRAKTMSQNTSQIRLNPRNREYYPSYVELSTEEIIELSENEIFNFAAIPREWTIGSGFYSGEVVEIRLEHALDKAGRDNEVDRFYQLRNERLISALEEDLPMETYFDRESSDLEITEKDSVEFWTIIDSLHQYLGMGELFVPVPRAERGAARSVRVKIETSRNPGAWRQFADWRNNNITGGGVSFPTVWRTMNIYHEMIHVLGPGHTCWWPTRMRRSCPPWTPWGENPIAHHSAVPTKHDVAYIQLLYATRQMQYDLSIPFGIEEAWEAIK